MLNETNEGETICLISKEPIEHKITLPCSHSYEYYYLYQEVIQQKNRHTHYFKCPYCRFIYNGTLPFYEINEVDKIVQINYNEKTVIPVFKCSTEGCEKHGNKYVTGEFCKLHHKKMSEIKCSGTCKNGSVCKNKATVGHNYCKKHLIIDSK